MMTAERYSLRLYVAGSTPRSMQAVKNIRNICERHLAGLYDLEVIDIYQHPEAAAGAQIIAAPTLIKVSPAPARRAIGDLSNEQKVLSTLSLPIIDHHEN
ncbi:circadian clock KaiB family protein [Ramlibacter sp.]|uniref:circadian clock KaiB family protein n=1 Tax=Ramlibacter sp. TaxID=1917967 RepID=UPI0026162DDB|nr:circadian clock KaiB family protein [Ramlibacter sp.]